MRNAGTDKEESRKEKKDKYEKSSVQSVRVVPQKSEPNCGCPGEGKRKRGGKREPGNSHAFYAGGSVIAGSLKSRASNDRRPGQEGTRERA